MKANPFKGWKPASPGWAGVYLLPLFLCAALAACDPWTSQVPLFKGQHLDRPLTKPGIYSVNRFGENSTVPFRVTMTDDDEYQFENISQAEKYDSYRISFRSTKEKAWLAQIVSLKDGKISYALLWRKNARHFLFTVPMCVGGGSRSIAVISGATEECAFETLEDLSLAAERYYVAAREKGGDAVAYSLTYSGDGQ